MAEITKQALKVDNNTSFPNNNNGAITPAILRAFNVNMIDSMVDELGYNVDSASWNQQIDSLEVFSGSTNVSISNLNQSSASQQVSINNINAFTASAIGLSTGSLLVTASAVSNVITFTKGDASTFNVTVADTTDLSQLNQATASLQAYTASANIKFANLDSTTASLNSSITQLNASSASQQVSINNLNTTTASLLVETQNLELFSASALISISNLNQSSASQQTQINSLIAATGSFATTGSNTFTGPNTFTSISASSFVSASEFIGNGSKITGITASISMPILDEGIPQGNAVSLNFTGSGVGASVVGGVAIISVYSVDTASFNSLTASFNTYTSSTNSSITQLNANTASQQVSIDNLNLYTSSFNTNTLVSTASFNSYTSSNDQRVSSLETNSASVNISISALNTYTASQSTASLVTSIDNLNTFSASALTSISNLNSATASLQSATASLFTSASLGLTTASFSGNTLTFTKGDASTFGVVIPDVSGSAGTTVIEVVYTGESITKGDPLYISGSQGANPIVFKADASNPAKMPVTFISNETIGAANTTNAIVLGLIEGIDLTGYTAGQTIYVAEGGGYSINLPSGSNSITQLLGVITKGGSGGKGLVLNPGPAQLPGLDTGYMWVGGTTNQPVEITTASFASSASFNTYTSSNDQKVNSLIAATGSYATTGSNSFNGNQIITGSVYISSSATVDLRVEGQIFVSSSATGGTTAPKITVSGSAGQSIINRNSISTRNTTDNGGIFPSTIFTGDVATSDEIGFTIDTSVFGITGWSTGPAIYVNNTALDTYPAVFGFQNKANLTDGRVAVLTPLSASAGFTASLQNGYAWVGNSLGQNTQVATSSFIDTIDTGSFVTTSSFNEYTASQSTGSLVTSITSLNTFTSSVVLLNANNIITGSQIMSGSLKITGSAFGNVISMSIASNTASMDLNTGNYFTLSIPTGTTRISPSNIQSGTSATLVITTASGSLVTFDSSVKQPSGSAYVPTSGSIDILSFVSVNSSSLFVVSTKNMI